jgi:hypothetical protein
MACLVLTQAHASKGQGLLTTRQQGESGRCCHGMTRHTEQRVARGLLAPCPFDASVACVGAKTVRVTLAPPDGPVFSMFLAALSLLTSHTGTL